MIKLRQHSKLAAAIGAVGCLAGIGQVAGSTIITSNLSGDESAQATVCASTGEPLPAGAKGMLGAFPDMTDAQVVELLASAGLDGLLGAFVQIGEAFAVGQGGAAEDGYFEISAHESLAPSGAMSAVSGAPPFVLLFDAPELPEATEILVLKLAAATFPTDPEIGLETYLAVHLRDAVAVVGTRDEIGFLASAIPPGEPVAFADWIVDRLGPDAPAADRLPLADPDRDHLTNLAEFGMGFHPGQADTADLPAPSIVGSQSLRYVFRHRTDAAGLMVKVERSDSLAGPWTDAGLPFAPADSSGLPLGIDRSAVDLPMDGSRELFARLRFELLE